MARIRACSVCGEPTTLREHCRPRPVRQPARHTYAWTQLSLQVRAEWVAEHGWVCPGWKRDAHASRDLTVDHIVAAAEDSTLFFERSNLRVLCRSCNWRRGLGSIAALRRRRA